jgi:serine/threonine protein kinase
VLVVEAETAGAQAEVQYTNGAYDQRVLALALRQPLPMTHVSRSGCMQIIHHICECLADLHHTGYVHRDLKPGNIMWLPSQNRWTLIDFGCAARIDEEAPTGFSLMYAAPEVVKAHLRDKRSTVLATTSLDAWSIGVIAVELFSGRPPLSLLQGQEKVGHFDYLPGALREPCAKASTSWQ